MINSPSVIANLFQPKHKDKRVYGQLIISPHQSAAPWTFSLASVNKLTVNTLAAALLTGSLWVSLL